MDKRIPEVIRPMLQDYLDQLEQQLPGLVESVYLHGSIALDAFDEQRSDIDFIAFIKRTETSVETMDITKLYTQLIHIHQTLSKEYPRWLLEGSYLQGPYVGQRKPNLLRYFSHHDNILLGATGQYDTSPVTWWLLQHKGIALLGAEPRELPFMADWEAVRAYMRENINTYWASFTHKPPRMIRSLSDEGVAWIVLGVLRQYYSFREHDITSKVWAGEYALKVLPSEWHDLIQDALDIRRGKKPRRYSSRFTRAYATIRFVRYVIDESNVLA
jgi:hypothetical protein